MGDFNALPESSVIQKVNQVLQNIETNSITPTWSVYKEGCTCLTKMGKLNINWIIYLQAKI